MKEKEMNEIIEERFKTIDKLSHTIIKDFDVDNIHDFRVEVKKLRAFLRLLDIKKEDNEPVIPSLLKTFYGYIGIVRNIQLYRHSLYKYIAAHNIDKPAAYFKLLSNEEAYWKKQAEALMADNNFKDVKEKIIKSLPDKLEKSTIKKFVEGKLDDLKEQLEDINDEVGLHTIRKILKDYLYTYDYINDHADLPKAISDKDNLKLLTQMLGDFIDKFMQLGYLQPEYLDKIKDENEKSNLLQMKNDFEHEKQGMKQELKYSLKKLQQQL
jgi:CHAD domain-containing protein